MHQVQHMQHTNQTVLAHILNCLLRQMTMLEPMTAFQVACFRKLPAKDGSLEKWVYLDTRRPHTHDVRAMLVLNPADADSLLLTGANDAQLFAYSVQHFQTVSVLPLCPPLSAWTHAVMQQCQLAEQGASGLSAAAGCDYSDHAEMVRKMAHALASMHMHPSTHLTLPASSCHVCLCMQCLELFTVLEMCIE